ncbi:MAG: hypothetical protein CME59_15395 [Halioglobus sp.]|nr:hypothetical protein [Halioglobus sp.]|tara:strand:+ start:390 stop:875 length:486 start_codon:yes stop_codon:yes gene_type:complete
MKNLTRTRLWFIVSAIWALGVLLAHLGDIRHGYQAWQEVRVMPLAEDVQQRWRACFEQSGYAGGSYYDYLFVAEERCLERQVDLDEAQLRFCVMNDYPVCTHLLPAELPRRSYWSTRYSLVFLDIVLWSVTLPIALLFLPALLRAARKAYVMLKAALPGAE